MNNESPWADASKKNTDITGRAEFAAAVAARISQCEIGQPSTVFGVVGPWGSGKTTLLSEVGGQLKDWTIVWFTPWSVADVASVATEFVAALVEAFPQSPGVKEKLASYSRFGTPVLKLIPVVGEAMAALAEVTAADIVKRPSWHSAFGALSEEIEEQGKRVLIVVDDVDRLDGDELRAVLKVVRLLGRFTNVHYLLAYDQATIERVLRSTAADGHDSEFMEKIVQYPFEIPPISKIVRRRWSKSAIDAGAPTGVTTDRSYGAYRDELVEVLAMGLETPRGAERLSEQLRSMAALVATAEIDALDFTALTWLRIAHHQVWEDIRSHPNDYLDWLAGDPAETEQRRSMRIKDLVQRGSLEAVQKTVRYLFEPIELQSVEAAHRLGRRMRIRNSRYFDRYFQVGLADDDVSDMRTQNALIELQAGVADSADVKLLKSIVLGDDEERAALALDVATRFRTAGLSSSPALLQFVADLNSALTTTSEHSSPANYSDRWLGREIYLALSTNVVTLDALVDRFGYRLVMASAYAAKGARLADPDSIRAIYRPMAEKWVDQVRAEMLESTLQREEILTMTAFAAWVGAGERINGFLASRVNSGEDLVRIAGMYVSFDEWLGSDVEYDLRFRSSEFSLAVEGAVTNAILSEVPHAREVPDYEFNDRPSRDLTDDQRRDFALRGIHSINWFGAEPNPEARGT